ncbi:MAG: AAA family ATPase [Candidatus Absconditabacteria bacterium]
MVDFSNNPQAKEALNIMLQSNQNLFLTGKAGTGKSTLIKEFIRLNNESQEYKKNVVILSHTGISALNAGGQTINRFFGLSKKKGAHFIKFALHGPYISGYSENENVKKIFDYLDMIILDEISMVSPDTLDFIDLICKKFKQSNLPFGGVQMVLVGDLFQLSPIINSEDRQLPYYKVYPGLSYFFQSLIYSTFDIRNIELRKIYRQKDLEYVKLLNKVRDNSITEIDLLKLNNRVIRQVNDEIINLCFYRRIKNQDGFDDSTTSDFINNQRLKKLQGNEYKLKPKLSNESLFNRKELNDITSIIKVKVGARIMMIKNDINNKRVNGSTGNVIQINNINGEYELKIHLDNGSEVLVKREKWDIVEYKYNPITKKLDEYIIGTVHQYPIQLARAISVHKSQGLTFDKVNIHVGKGAFANGQLYVALSRCKSYEGLHLSKAIAYQDIKVDERVKEFMKETFLDENNEIDIAEDTTDIKEINPIQDNSTIIDNLNIIDKEQLTKLNNSIEVLINEISKFNETAINSLNQNEDDVSNYTKVLDNLDDRMNLYNETFNQKLSELDIGISQLSNNLEYYNTQLVDKLNSDKEEIINNKNQSDKLIPNSKFTEIKTYGLQGVVVFLIIIFVYFFSIQYKAIDDKLFQANLLIQDMNNKPKNANLISSSEMNFDPNILLERCQEAKNILPIDSPKYEQLEKFEKYLLTYKSTVEKIKTTIPEIEE